MARGRRCSSPLWRLTNDRLFVCTPTWRTRVSRVPVSTCACRCARSLALVPVVVIRPLGHWAIAASTVANCHAERQQRLTDDRFEDDDYGRSNVTDGSERRRGSKDRGRGVRRTDAASRPPGVTCIVSGTTLSWTQSVSHTLATKAETRAANGGPTSDSTASYLVNGLCVA